MDEAEIIAMYKRIMNAAIDEAYERGYARGYTAGKLGLAEPAPFSSAANVSHPSCSETKT